VFSFPSHPFDYQDPWAVPLGFRLRDFFHEKVRVAYYYHQPDNSTFRYRCFNMSRAINTYVPGMSSSWFCMKDDDRYLEWVAKQADVIVVCRSLYNSKIARFIQLCHRWGKTVLFDCDDYVFDLSVVPDVVETVNQTTVPGREEMWTDWFGRVGRYRATLDMCDGLIVTNDYLAARAAEVVDCPVYVIPNFMGDEQVDYSASLVKAKQRSQHKRDGLFHIGYFSGTPSHDRDFALVTDALRSILLTCPHTRLRVVGFIDLATTCLAGLDERIEFTPLVNYMELQRLIAQTELNIAPLQENAFTNCKSELKYFDAGIVEVPTIASPTFTMENAISDHINGVICSDGDWRTAIMEFVDDYDAIGLPMGRAAYDRCMATYTAETVAPTIRKVLRRGGHIDQPDL